MQNKSGLLQQWKVDDDLLIHLLLNGYITRGMWHTVYETGVSAGKSLAVCLNENNINKWSTPIGTAAVLTSWAGACIDSDRRNDIDCLRESILVI